MSMSSRFFIIKVNLNLGTGCIDLKKYIYTEQNLFLIV